MTSQSLSSEVRSFGDPDEYTAAMRGAKVELSVLAAAPFTADITYIAFNSVRVQRFAGSVPRIMHSQITNDRAVICLHTEPGPGLIRGGTELTSDSVARLALNQSSFQRVTGSVRWGTISLPVETIVSEGVGAGCDLTPPRSDLIVTPDASAMAELRRLHASVGRVAETAPEVIEIPEVARGMEQAFIEALAVCLGTDQSREDTAGQRRHKTIMQRFHQMLDAEASRPIYVLEMAEAVGVSIRCLSACCLEHLGMGAKKYLQLRRMHLARKALHFADPNETAVSDVATQYGFWEFGRFAANYKLLFGMSPSTTLRNKQPGSSARH